VLAVFDIAGFTQYLRVFGLQAGDELIVALSALFRNALGSAKCYRPRQDEFMALIAGVASEAARLLVVAEQALRREGDASLITTSFGCVRLPDEATRPIDALRLADSRLEALTNRAPRERRDGRRWDSDQISD
jgi:GGDEF domain-containing protein